MDTTVLKTTVVTASLALVTLTACGGGGSASPTPTPTPTPAPVQTPTPTPTPTPSTFPLQQVMANIYSKGVNQTVSMSGTASESGNPYALTGSAQVAVVPATISTSFNGQTALQGSASVTGSLAANGQTISYASSNQVFVDTNYNNLGNSSASSYCVASAPAAVPAS